MEEYPIFDESEVDQTTIENLRRELANAQADLRAHLASWEYAYAMGSTLHDGGNHPLHVATRSRTDNLTMRVKELELLLEEFDI
jgi:hypothetical protein